MGMSDKEMFAVVRQAIWRKAATARLSGRAWSVLVVLWGYADAETGRSFPGLTALSRETGIEARDIPRVVDELIAAGLVVKIRNGVRSYGRICNLYILTSTVEFTDGEMTGG
jgi:DNA-binding MarR family transcriptional regulator